ncbi:ParB/RepB/Spo0J family partition protein [candidate division NPL-UPA2 bacterium]|nr:ParB/RepB/Spo0J family partition protein [candidate division NPL-UPA2 bacterium]
MAKKVLGKGLESLIPGVSLGKEQRVRELKLSEIRPNRYQPREKFDKTQMEGLISSIREKGVVQPILVRGQLLEGVGPGEYELIAGERRLRAAREVGLARIPAIVREASERDMLEISLLENVQREDLGPIEEAEALRRLMKEFEFTQEELARRLGKERSTLANTLRLLKLPAEVQGEVREGAISAGHARALLALPDAKEQKRLVSHIKQRRLSVRETERLVEGLKGKLSAQGKRRGRVLKKRKEPQIQAIENGLCRFFGTQVMIKPRGQGGWIQIAYYSGEDMERLLEILEAGKEERREVGENYK